jgi:hypothetical protein
MTFIPAEMLGGDPSAIFHVGYVVEDLADAMAQLTDTLGTRWVDHFVDVRYRSDTGTTVEAHLHTCYSLDGPAHIELIEAAPNTVWALDGRSTMHHIGLWSDDIPAEAERLARSGMPAVATGLGPSGESADGFFSFHDNPIGGKVELVDVSKQQALYEWIRG